MDVMIKNFENQYPKVNIEPSYVAVAAYPSLLLTEFQAGTAPDVFWMNASPPQNVPALGPRGADRLADLSGLPFIKRMIPAARSAVAAQHKIWAAPLGITVVGIIYNTDLFQSLGLKPPTVFPELLADCQMIAAAGKYPFSYIANNATYVYLGPDTFVYSADPKWTIERNAHKVTFAGSAQWRRVFSAWAQMKQANCFPPYAPSGTNAQMYGEMARGQAAMVIQAASQMANIQAINPNVKLNIFAFPGDKASQDGLVFAPSSALGISKTTSNSDAARAFINFVMRPKQNSLANKVANTISMSDYTKGIWPAAFSGLRPAAKQRTSLAALLSWPVATRAAFNKAIDGLVTGQVTVDGALQLMDTAWDQK
jgi:ABC-type glycerol-3-phosphate transport system substrate-binding protein